MPESNPPPAFGMSAGSASLLFGLPADGAVRPGVVLAVPVFLPLAPGSLVGQPGADDRVGQLMAAVRDFYTATGRWPLGTDLAAPGEPGPARGQTVAPAGAAARAINPSAVATAPGAEPVPAVGPGLNPTAAAAGAPGREPSSPAGLNPMAAGSAPPPEEGRRSAPKPRPRRRSPR